MGQPGGVNEWKPTNERENGPTEEHINKLKMIKCSAYGRIKRDLLRQRVLHAA
jgi:transposase